MKIIMPQLGLTMEEGTVESWHKQPGDYIRKGEVLVEISNDKATTEIEAPEDGTLEQILVQEGTTVPVGETLALLNVVGEVAQVVQSVLVMAGASSNSHAIGRTATLPTIEPEDEIVEPLIKTSPLARRIAREHNLDLMLLSGKGTGPGGRIVERDVLGLLETQAQPQVEADLQIEASAMAHSLETPASIEAPANAPSETAFRLVPLNSIRATTARRLSESARTTVPVTLNVEADVTRLIKLRKELISDNSKVADRVTLQAELQKSKLTYTDLIVLALGRALSRHPYMNSTLVEGETGQRPSLKIWNEVNLGLAIALDGTDGLVVPVIRGIEQMGLRQLAQKRTELIEKAKEGRLTLSDYEGATFTLSNLGGYRVDSFNPVINLPQVALLGVGRIVRKPGLNNKKGIIHPRDYLTLNLTFDHRAIDGAPAAAFLTELVELLERPTRLLL